MQFINERKQMKKQAHNWVKNDYGKMFLVYSPLIALLIITRFFQGHSIIVFLLSLVTLLVGFGVMSVSVHLLRGQVPKVPYLKMAFNDFKQPGAFKSSVVILLRMYWLLILATLFKAHALIAFVLMIVWFVRMLQLSMSPYIYADALANHNNISAEQAIKGSEQLMKGHIKEYFILSLSLIGWGILTVLPFTLCILSAYTIPYLQLVLAEYYIYLTQNHPSAPATATVPNQPNNPTPSKPSPTPNNVYPNINNNKPKAKKNGKGFLHSFNAMFHKFDKKPAKPSTPKPNTNNGMGLNNNQPTGLGLKGGQTTAPRMSMNNTNSSQTQTQVQNPNPTTPNIPNMSNKVSVNTQQQPVNNMQAQPQQPKQPQMPNMPKMAMPNMNNQTQNQPTQQSQPNQVQQQPQANPQPQKATQSSMPNMNVNNQATQQPRQTNNVANPTQSKPVSPNMAMNSNPDNPVNNTSWSQKIQQISQKYNSQPKPQAQPNPQPQKSVNNPQSRQSVNNNFNPAPQNPRPQQSQPKNSLSTPQGEMDEIKRIEREQGQQN